MIVEGGRGWAGFVVRGELAERLVHAAVTDDYSRQAIVAGR